jgi:cellulose synthase/poly-beta-1,6-N-acetylglucosamine synthase-like glycosyltransferase
MELFFIISLFLSIYSYAVYPALLFAGATVFQTPWKREKSIPAVSIIVSAYNEEKDIGDKIRNALQLDYPEKQLEIIVSSDGSTDRTNEIVTGIRDSRLVLRTFEDRQGKTACLNKVIPKAKGDIILFTDANSMFEKDMLQNLVQNFADPGVGAVTGWTKYRNPDSGEETTGLYARFEQKTKLHESMISSCVGADGAIFAIRKELYRPLGTNDINDFIIPLNIVKQAKRVILDPAVFCYEETTKGLQNIFKRQVRITTRTAWALRRNAELLNFFRYGSFSFFLLSHKMIRLLTPFFLLAALTANILIYDKSLLYTLTLWGQLLFFFAGIASLSGLIRGGVFSICKYFIITFSAQFIGCLRMAAGIEDVMWTPKR